MASSPGSRTDGDNVRPFGLIDFDQYLIQHWDLSHPIETDKDQWRQLVQQYWQLYPRERWPYHKAKLDAEDAWRNQDQPPPPHPVLEQRIAPFQTPLERSLGDGLGTQCCLRTCYDAELEDNYQQFISDYQIHGEGILYASGNILDDAERYDEADPMEVMYNIPGYTDVVDVIDEELYDELLPWSDEEWAAKDPGDPGKAAAEVYNIIIIIDREALEEGFLKAKWLNWKSEVVWENKLHWGAVDTFVQIWLQGYGIGDLSQTNGDIIGRLPSP